MLRFWRLTFVDDFLQHIYKRRATTKPHTSHNKSEKEDSNSKVSEHTNKLTLKWCKGEEGKKKRCHTGCATGFVCKHLQGLTIYWIKRFGEINTIKQIFFFVVFFCLLSILCGCTFRGSDLFENGMVQFLWQYMNIFRINKKIKKWLSKKNLRFSIWMLKNNLKHTELFETW